jgi:D-sedoheptulose 7-phosphate isomerase
MEVSAPQFNTQAYVAEARRMLDVLASQADAFVAALYDAFLQDRTLFIAGNGGSAANASHFAQDLNKGTLLRVDATKRFRAIALTDNLSWITAIANDHGYDAIFEYQLRTLARPGDILVAISGSGNSANVVRAVEYANTHEMKTLAVTGYDGGTLRPAAAVSLHVPSFDMGLVEGMHSVIFHLTIGALRERLSGQQS